MYSPPHFVEPDLKVMQALIRAQPLATLVTLASSGLTANHIPLHLAADASEHGVLSGHLARANSVWQDFSKNTEVLAVFQGPNAYISPSWYPSKLETGRVVPTWNYATVHAYGIMRVIDDPAWLRKQLEALTAHNEASFPKPWKVADAPLDFTEKLMTSIIGFEISITRLIGKWKVSQNQPLQNQQGVISGLQATDQPESAALVAAKLNNT